MNNTIHQPQEILLKVMCSERLPSKEGRYYTFTNTSPFGTNYFNGNRFETFPFIDVIAWYEPATRIVLTVEEWEEISKKLFMYDNGLGDRDMINDNKPTDI